ncbi:hypothetical protein AC520_4001 [Enterobacter sp. OLF]|nr:hypothetical protein AC520_4001 [Enterobacter sp. OLF]
MQEKRARPGPSSGNLLLLYKSVAPVELKRQLLFAEAYSERV